MLFVNGSEAWLSRVAPGEEQSFPELDSDDDMESLAGDDEPWLPWQPFMVNWRSEHGYLTPIAFSTSRGLQQFSDDFGSSLTFE